MISVLSEVFVCMSSKILYLLSSMRFIFPYIIFYIFRKSKRRIGESCIISCVFIEKEVRSFALHPVMDVLPSGQRMQARRKGGTAGLRHVGRGRTCKTDANGGGMLHTATPCFMRSLKGDTFITGCKSLKAPGFFFRHESCAHILWHVCRLPECSLKHRRAAVRALPASFRRCARCR